MVSEVNIVFCKSNKSNFSIDDKDIQKLNTEGQLSGFVNPINGTLSQGYNLVKLKASGKFFSETIKSIGIEAVV